MTVLRKKGPIASLFGALALALIFAANTQLDSGSVVPSDTAARPSAPPASLHRDGRPSTSLVARSELPPTVRLAAWDAMLDRPVTSFQVRLPDSSSDPDSSVSAGENGVATLALPDAETQVVITSAGYVDRVVEAGAIFSLSGNELCDHLIKLRPKGELTGRAYFSDGEPAVGATVIAFEDVRTPWACLSPDGQAHGAAAEVDGAGEFTLQLDPNLESIHVTVVGAGAYLPQTEIDLAAARESQFEIECARARAVIATIQWPPDRVPFPEAGVGFPYSHVKRNIDLWGVEPMELPDSLLRFYIPGFTSAHQQSPFEVSAVLAQAGSTLESCEVQVDVKYPGYRRERFRAAFDLKEKEPYHIAVGLVPDGPEPGQLDLAFDISDQVPIPTGRGHDMWVRLTDKLQGSVVDCAVKLKRSPQVCSIAGIPPGTYALSWRPGDFGGPYVPLVDDQFEVTIKSGEIASVKVPSTAISWWVFKGREVPDSFAGQELRLYASKSTSLDAREAFRGEAGNVWLGGGEAFPVALQPERSYRARFIGNPFFAADGSVIPVDESADAKDRFVSCVFVGGQVEELWLDAFAQSDE